MVLKDVSNRNNLSEKNFLLSYFTDFTVFIYNQSENIKNQITEFMLIIISLFSMTFLFFETVFIFFMVCIFLLNLLILKVVLNKYIKATSFLCCATKPF